MIDASFNRFESLVLYRIQCDIVISLLPNLITLLCVFSLKIELNDQLRHFSNPYGLFFSLSLLKYNKISVIRKFSPILQPY